MDIAKYRKMVKSWDIEVNNYPENAGMAFDIINAKAASVNNMMSVRKFCEKKNVNFSTVYGWNRNRDGLYDMEVFKKLLS